MAYYKDIQIPDRLNGVIGQMESVESTREQLVNLGQHWDLLTILGQMSGTGTDMTKTREGFKELTAQLITCLGEETLNKTIQDLTSKAQVTVDIVIRNLFERTADIGFLATDDDIRNYLRLAEKEASSSTDTSLITQRFQEYVAKYSVYDNIILLDTKGQVVAQLDASNNIQQSYDPLIQDALKTSEEYCEIYRKTDLVPSKENSLIYAYRVTDSNNSSRNLGVLCLCFRFEDELNGVFNNLVTPSDWSVLLLLDKNGYTIASSDKHHIPTGCQFIVDSKLEFELVKFCGRLYIAKKCDTKGYQGFKGLGWSGLAMIPIEHAFEAHKNNALLNVSDDILDTVMSQSKLFSKQIQQIPQDADRIQRELDRTVWNGNIIQRGKNNKSSSKSTKVLLWEISKTGAKTKQVFEKSIAELNSTVISSMLDDVEFLASLAIDIMDRNLYERANDCRWWALTSVFQEILNAKNIFSLKQKELSDILAYINDLYTVYTNLFVYDTHGKILAVSNPKEHNLVGTSINKNWVKETLSLRDTQHYSVSDFEATPLYGNRHTYVYGAAINAPNSYGQTVGGIAIVFDSEPEFLAMLTDALPVNENAEPVDGSFALFTNRHGDVLSSTDDDHKVGCKIELDSEFFELGQGEHLSKIIQYNDNFYAVGASCSSGYREYKSEHDTYKNDVISLVFMLIGNAQQANMSALTKNNSQTIQVKQLDEHASEDSIELATFFIGDNWLALRAEQVVEAIPYTEVKAAKSSNAIYLGPIIYKDVALPIINPVLSVVSSEDSQSFESESKQIVVVKTKRGLVGIVVNTLGDIPEINANSIEQFDRGLTKNNQFIEAIVKPANDIAGQKLLILVDPSKLIAHLMDSDVTIESALNDVALDS